MNNNERIRRFRDMAARGVVSQACADRMIAKLGGPLSATAKVPPALPGRPARAPQAFEALAEYLKQTNRKR